MRLLLRLVLGLALILSTTAGAIVLTAGPAAACSCVEMSVDFLDTNDVAFAGVVTAQRESGGTGIVTMRAERVFKGDVTKRVDVVDQEPHSTCGLEAQDGDRLIVFADLTDAEVTSNMCRTVRSPSQAYRETLAELGEGTEPSPGYLKAERRGIGLSYDQFVAGRAILGVLGLLGLAYLGYRTWRARRRTS